jgi:hypothetical protein
MKDRSERILEHGALLTICTLFISVTLITSCKPVEDTLPQPVIVIEEDESESVDTNRTDPPQPPMAPQQGES